MAPRSITAGLATLMSTWAGGFGGDPAGDTYATARRRLLAQVEEDFANLATHLGHACLSEAVAEALLSVPRHEFVPPGLRAFAWQNRALPIGLEQTISQPTVVALMTELLEPAPTDTILEVGTGSGYQAAVLASVVPRGMVHTIETIPELADAARDRLHRLGHRNVSVMTGDGRAGLAGAAPFDGIIVTAVTDKPPPALLAQLAPTARLVLPLADEQGDQWLTVVRRSPGGAWEYRTVLPVAFVPLTDGSAAGRRRAG